MTQNTSLALLKTIITEHQPASLLCLDEKAMILSHELEGPLESSLLDGRKWLTEGRFDTRHDLAVYREGPVDFESKEHRMLLSAARDLLARRVIAFVRKDGPVGEHDLRALGYTLLARPEEDLEAWTFDILTYKAVPDWLNPRFWANPENWNKFRW